MALISPAAKPVEVIEEHCWCCEVKFEAVTKPTAVPAAAATAAAAANGVSEFNVSADEGDTTAAEAGETVGLLATAAAAAAADTATGEPELADVAEAEVGESSSP